MHYIINHDSRVIAASSDFLALLQVESIDALYTQMALGTIDIVLDTNHVTVTTPHDSLDYTIETVPLSSILGGMTLVHLFTETLQEALEEEKAETAAGEHFSLLDDEPEEILFNLKETPDTQAEEADTHEHAPLFEEEEAFSIKEETDEDLINFTEEDSTPQKKHPFDDEEEILFGIKPIEENTREPEKKEVQEVPFDETALFDLKKEKPLEKVSLPEEKEEEALMELVLPSSADEHLDIIETEKTTPQNNMPVYIDIEKTSQSIGISPEDYNIFLTEYIDTALSLEEDLRSHDKNRRTAATHTLFHLSNVLRIPVITEIIEQIKYTEEEDIESSIESFYHTLNRLSTAQPAADTQTETTETPLVEESQPTPQEIPAGGFGTIDLSDVKPIHFDFRVEEAAEELSLPAELIEEFIHDFIKQAHEETEKMLQAYEKGDLETINKIGHLLKGTSSNLRINPLADTLYEIQFCDESSKLEKLIKEYWAHFLAFETQFNLIANKGD